MQIRAAHLPNGARLLCSAVGVLEPAKVSTVLKRVPNLAVAVFNYGLHYHTPTNFGGMLDELFARADSLTRSQLAQGITFPVGIEAGACSLVEAWAAGEEWGALVANTSLDSGDIYRILRRTMELLRSITSVPYVSRGVQRRAAAGLRAMNRYPLADNALMGLPGMAAEADVEDEDAATEEEEEQGAAEAV